MKNAFPKMKINKLFLIFLISEFITYIAFSEEQVQASRNQEETVSGQSTSSPYQTKEDKTNPKEIKLEAFQFGYSPDTIRVKKGDKVKISATSRDVPHGFYIKEYNINATIRKGEFERIEFIADKAGTFDIICSVYCGKGHHDMKAKLIVEE